MSRVQAAVMARVQAAVMATSKKCHADRKQYIADQS